MGKEVFEKIIKMLDEQKVSYEHLTHEHVHSSQDTAKIRGSSIEQAAKAIILKIKPKGSESYSIIQCVLPGNTKILLKNLRKMLNLKSISLASPEEVFEKTNCTIGSVPPFGNMFDLITYADESLFNQDELVFSAGTHNDSIRIKSEDWKKVVKPVVERFAEVFVQ